MPFKKKKKTEGNRRNFQKKVSNKSLKKKTLNKPLKILRKNSKKLAPVQIKDFSVKNFMMLKKNLNDFNWILFKIVANINKILRTSTLKLLGLTKLDNSCKMKLKTIK